MPTDAVNILSLLHEDAAAFSATRRFRGSPVLDWTLRRIAACDDLNDAAVVCWDDQLPFVAPIVAARGTHAFSQGPRVALPHVAAVAAARRWADGWRGGPLGTSAFDAGFHAPAVRDIADRFGAAAVVLVDPAAALVDPDLIAAVVRQWRDHPARDFTFAPAATGLGCMLLSRELLDRLVAAAGAHPGRLLHYFPDQHSREPIAADGCAPTPTSVARSPHRYTLTSDRQVRRIEAATADLNGQLIGSGSEAIVARLHAADAADTLPREVVLELTTRRSSKPIFSPLAANPIDRSDLSLDVARRLIDELAAVDDSRLTLAGIGDPMLHPDVIAIIEHAAAAGVATNVESDLLNADPAAVLALADSSADVLSIHLPAVTAGTYAAVMGVDGYPRALNNLQLFVARRADKGKPTPLIVPMFVKCRANLHEMEAWYDQWLRAVGSAAIAGPSTFGGAIPDVAAADMTPPKRSPCRRLVERLTVLSDGRFASCEQDVHGRQSAGRVGDISLASVWQGQFAALRKTHADGRWNESPICARCREWHRA